MQPPHRRARAVRAALAGAAALSLVQASVAQEKSGFWSAPEGTTAWITYMRESFDEYRVGSSKTALSGEVVRERWAVGAAHFWREDLELWFDAAYAVNEAAAALEVEDERGPQDLRLGSSLRIRRRRLASGELSLYLAPSVKVPLGSYDTESVTSLGDGQLDLLGHVVARYRFDAGPFLSLETGLDVRLEEPANELPLYLSFGAPLGAGVTCVATYGRVESLGGEDLNSAEGKPTAAPGGGKAGGSDSFAALDEDSESVGLAVYVPLAEGVDLYAGVHRTLGGANTPLAEGFTVGVVFGW